MQSLKLNAEQLKPVEYAGSCTVLGAPGTGKTTVLFEKAARLVAQGVAPQDICFIAFSYRSMLVMQYQLHQLLGKAAQGIQVGTLLDLPLKVMAAKDGENAPHVADNTQVRRFLRQAMVETGFPGNVGEAEHIMRLFKSRARKPSDDEPYFKLYQAYKHLLEKSGMVDRHDLVRKHIIGMRNDVYQPYPAKYMMIDNVQDITQIQLLWVVDHLKAGIKVTAAGCDDLCMFERSGALAGSAFTDLEEQNDMPRFTLSQNWRLRDGIAKSADILAKPIRGRLEKPTIHPAQGQAQVEVTSLNSVDDELKILVHHVQAILAQPNTRIGVITRYDLMNRRVERALRHAGVPFASFARPIWEAAGPQLVLDLLEVLMNRAGDGKLKNVLSGFGVPQNAVETLFTNGLMADGWLKQGAPLPPDLALSLTATTLREVGQLQRRLLGYYKMMHTAGPKNVFKAAAFDLLSRMREDDRVDALHALDELLTLKGNLSQMLDTLQNTHPLEPGARVIVAPLRECRNMAFTHVLVPFVSSRIFPLNYRVLGVDENTDRRMLYMAVTRASQYVGLSYSATPSIFLEDLKGVAGQSAA